MDGSSDVSMPDVSSKLLSLENRLVAALPRIASLEHTTTNGFKHLHRWVQRVEYRTVRLEKPQARPLQAAETSPAKPSRDEATETAAATTAVQLPALAPAEPSRPHVGHRGPGAIVSSLIPHRRSTPTSVTLSLSLYLSAAGGPEHCDIGSIVGHDLRENV